jgi:hypothetical protein
VFTIFVIDDKINLIRWWLTLKIVIHLFIVFAMSDNPPIVRTSILHCLLLIGFQQKAVRRRSIDVQRPDPATVPAITRSNKKVRSDDAWMDKDDKRSVIRYKNYLDYAPKIVLPVSVRRLRMLLKKAGHAVLEANMERLMAPSHPALCTSAQYLDRNGVPLLYYFGRRLVRTGALKVSPTFYFHLAIPHSMCIF